MQNAAAYGAAIRPDGRTHIVNAIAIDLASLIARIQGSAKLIESAIASETAFVGHEAADIVVFNNDTPCYLKAQGQRDACSPGIGASLHSLIEVNLNRTDEGQLGRVDSNVGD